MRLILLITCCTVYSLFNAQTSNVSVEFNASAEGDISIYGIANNSSLTKSYGLYGVSDATDGVGTYGSGRTGVFGQGEFGIFGSGTLRAGYFLGDLEYTGAIHGAPSDIKLKNLLLKENSILELIMGLRVEKYTYKQNEFKQLNLSEGIQYGFIAQNLEKTFPNLVRESHSLAFYSAEEGSFVESVDYKTVNYIGMIPILTEGIKELNGKIERQEKLIQVLIAELSVLKRK